MHQTNVSCFNPLDIIDIDKQKKKICKTETYFCFYGPRKVFRHVVTKKDHAKISAPIGPIFKKGFFFHGVPWN